MKIYSHLFAIANLLALFNATLTNDILPLGASPDLSPLYSGPTFQCFDKSRTIDFTQVNDDYCDCNDGSDEPGTSACPNSRFYCQNKGYVSKYIPGNFVNDFICDCCDGSDEIQNNSCPNTCEKLAESLNLKKNELHSSFEEGHRIYREFIEHVDIKLANKIEETRKRLEEEAIQEREVEIQRRKEKLERRAEEARKKAEEDTKTEAKEETAETPEDSQEFDPDREAERLLMDEEKDSEGHPNQPEEPIPATQDNEEDLDLENIPLKEIKVPEIDYGPNNAFLMLAENDPVTCLELSVDEYIYRMCPFENVYQKPKAGGSETLLGSWSKWLVRDHVGSEPLVMLFENGQSCWQGPSRSATVKVTCGKENILTSASEPSRCEYLLTMESPAGCHLPPKELLNNVKLSHDEL